jgi:hypothetical protein
VLEDSYSRDLQIEFNKCIAASRPKFHKKSEHFTKPSGHSLKGPVLINTGTYPRPEKINHLKQFLLKIQTKAKLSKLEYRRINRKTASSVIVQFYSRGKQVAVMYVLCSVAHKESFFNFRFNHELPSDIQRGITRGPWNINKYIC